MHTSATTDTTTQLLLDNFDWAVVQLDAEHCVSYCNFAATVVFSLSRKKMIGMQFSSLYREGLDFLNKISQDIEFDDVKFVKANGENIRIQLKYRHLAQGVAIYCQILPEQSNHVQIPKTVTDTLNSWLNQLNTKLSDVKFALVCLQEMIMWNNPQISKELLTQGEMQWQQILKLLDIEISTLKQQNEWLVASEKEKINLHWIIEDSLSSEVQLNKKKSIALTRKFDPSIEHVYINPKLITRVVDTLLKKFISFSQSVDITTGIYTDKLSGTCVQACFRFVLQDKQQNSMFNDTAWLRDSLLMKLALQNQNAQIEYLNDTEHGNIKVTILIPTAKAKKHTNYLSASDG